MDNKRKNVVLIDVMKGDRFVCQVPYNKRGFPAMVDGRIVERYSQRDIEKYIYEKYPSFKDKGYEFVIASMRVFRR